MNCRYPIQERRKRPILRIPAQETKTFPVRSDDWPENYPALIKPWLGGLRAYWVERMQAFQLEDGSLRRVDGIEPFNPDEGGPNFLGEFWGKGLDIDEIVEQVETNSPSEELDFTIFDAEMNETAKERSVYCHSLPFQAERHTRIAETYEVWTPGGFRTFLPGWRAAFNGALVVGIEDPWLSTEYEVKTLI